MRILSSLKTLINSLYSEVNDIYDDSIIDIVNFISILWSASLPQSNFNYQQFPFTNFNKKIILEVELEKYNNINCHWCYVRDGSFILSTQQKINFIGLYFKTITKENNSKKFTLVVRRDRILIDSFMKIANIGNPETEFKKSFFVEFDGEAGYDMGGVRREYFELIVRELFENTDSFFENKGNFYWFNPMATDETSLQVFYLSGVLLGIALFNGILLNVKFPIALYRKLLNLPIGLDELEEFDESIGRSMKDILNYKGDLEKDLMDFFVYSGIPLKPNGQNIPLTNENRDEYVKLVIDYIFNKSVHQQYTSWLRGIAITTGSFFTLKLFHPKELDLLFTGSDEIDFHEVESITKYKSPFNQNSIPVKNFWKIVHNDFNNQQKRDLLYFTTSSYRVPAAGARTMRFEIHQDSNPKNLPTSHTCFNQLVLPDDKDYKSLKKKLLIAIAQKEGFQTN
jgi:hypothetical protein